MGCGITSLARWRVGPEPAHSEIPLETTLQPVRVVGISSSFHCSRRAFLSKVCVLAPDHAVALEERGVVPDCRYHQHLSHREADAMIAADRDSKTSMLVEGWGRARTVHS